MPDPDVQAILDDLPPVSLPDVLREQGWGHWTMRDLRAYRVPVTPSTEQQPIYDHHCVGCGRPITMGKWYWTDHAGSTDCVQDLLDRPVPIEVRHIHIPADELEALERGRLAFEDPHPRKAKAQPLVCAATKAARRPGANHRHHCRHTHDHFGFHECAVDDCRILWR